MDSGNLCQLKKGDNSDEETGKSVDKHQYDVDEDMDERKCNVTASKFNHEIESEDESDDDMEEDDEESKVAFRKPIRDHIKSFILEEAEVDDEIEDEEEWEECGDDFGVSDDFAEQGPTPWEIDRQNRACRIWDCPRDEEIEDYIRRKYGSSSKESSLKSTEGIPEDITNQTLLPGIKDPSLWVVKCRLGEELTSALHLMRKCVTFLTSGTPLQIKSVVVPQGIKGFLYIEAFKRQHVKAAIEDIGTLRNGLWNQQMVPIPEMTDVLKVVKQEPLLKVKQWVRVKKGLYKGDIAQVVNLNLTENKVQLRLIPRIDCQTLRGALKNSGKETKVMRKKKQRPAAKLFNCETIRSIGGEVLTSGDFYIFEGNQYQDGFLYKHFPLNRILSSEVKPSLSELEAFKEEIDSVIHVEQDCSSNRFNIGDNVEVCSGELLHLTGKVVAFEGKMVLVSPRHDQLKDELLKFSAGELQKYFVVGDHVRVLAGRYEGETGLVIKVEDNGIYIFSDLTYDELTVLPQYLELCSHMTAGVDSLGCFQWGDLVQIDFQTVGVIVRLEKEIFQILSMYGKVVKLKPQAVHKRKESRFATALDADHNNIRAKDVVKVIEGPNAGQQGDVKYVYRNCVFVYSRMHLENGGIFVAKARHVQLAGGIRNCNVDTGTEPTLCPVKRPLDYNVKVNEDFRKGNKQLWGKTVKITRGPYKGCIGTLVDIHVNTVRIELHSSCQTISVDRSQLYFVEPVQATFVNTYSPPAIDRTPSRCQTPIYESPLTPYFEATSFYDGEFSTGAEPWDQGSSTPRNPESIALSPNDFNFNAAYPENDLSPAHLYRPSPLVSPNYLTYGYSDAPSPASGLSSINGRRTETSPPSPTKTPVQYGQFHQQKFHAEDYLKTNWITTEICVLIIDNHEDLGLRNQMGVVRSIVDKNCSVYLLSEDRLVNVNSWLLRPVLPQRGDVVKVILGEEKGTIGTLISIDNQEGVVKIGSGEIKLLQMRYLCRMERTTHVT